MSKMTEFYDRTFDESHKRHGDSITASRDAKAALEQREIDLYDRETELDEFVNYIKERYRRIIAKSFIAPFGECIMLVDRKYVREYTDWLKERGYDEQQP